jgi:hypothetical protein
MGSVLVMFIVIIRYIIITQHYFKYISIALKNLMH